MAKYINNCCDIVRVTGDHNLIFLNLLSHKSIEYILTLF